MYKKILVGVDGSENSMRAVEKAADLALCSGGEVHVFHAIKHFFEPSYFKIPILSDITPSLPQDISVILEAYKNMGMKLLKQAQELLKSKGLDEKIMKFTLEEFVSPEDFVEQYVKSNGIDLVAVGCSGHHSKLRSLFVGSVAQKISNKAPCDVVIIR